MSQSLQEAVVGLSQSQIEAGLRARGKNPDEYDIYPFHQPPILVNRNTRKWIPLSKVKAVVEKEAL